MYWRVDYEIAALFMLLAILFSFLKKRRAQEESLFFLLLLDSVLSVILNLVNVWVFSNRPQQLLLKRLLTAAVILGYSLQPFLMFSYLNIFYKREKRTKEYSRRTKILYSVPMILSAVYIAGSVFTGMVFRINYLGRIEASYGVVLVLCHEAFYFFTTWKEINTIEKKPGKMKRPPVYLIMGCCICNIVLLLQGGRTIYNGIFTATACMLLYHYVQQVKVTKTTEKRIRELEEQKQLLIQLTQESNIAKRQAEEADRAKSQFLANMSHEIRTPLNAIMGMTELILRARVQPQVKESAMNIRNAGESLISIINDILDISKIEAGKMEIHREPYHLKKLLQDVINVIVTRISGKKIQLLLDISPEIPEHLFGDEQRVKQILINLLNNAAKYTEKGYIRLTMGYCREEEGIILFGAVEDTGVGMTEEEIEYVFDSFVRVENFQNQTVEGTGLGLTICRQSLELMGGKIDVKSTYGQGSEFSFSLPQGVKGDEPLVQSAGKAGRKLLFLESYREQQKIIEKIVSDKKTKVDFAVSRPEFIKGLLSEEYSHCFLSWREYDKERESINSIVKEGRTELFVLEEYDEAAEELFAGKAIKKPLYCVNLMAALNGELYEYQRENKYSESFVAPEAKLLLIDDNLVNLKVAAGLLEPYQVQIDTASSGKAGISLLKKNKDYHLVLLDHMMPGMDGVETLRQIRSLEGDYYKKLPVIALTANALKEAQQMFVKKGFQDFIAKPVDTAVLEEKLAEYLPDDLKQSVLVAEASRKSLELSIEGIDVAAGLRPWNGNMEKYRRILETVYEEGLGKIKKMKECLGREDYRGYMMEAHSVKSVAAGIGAFALSELAKEQEALVKENKLAQVKEKSGKFLDSYEKQLRAMEGALQPAQAERGTREPMEEARAEKIVKRALELLADYEDEEAMEILSELLKYELPFYEQDFLTKAMDKLRHLDYNGAREELESRRRITNEEYIISR